MKVLPRWFLYQQEVYHHVHNLSYSLLYITKLSITPAPPTPTNVTQLMNASSFMVAWQWTSSGSVPSCFNTTHVTYRPERGVESSLQLSDPAATEATLTNLQCNTNYTITVMATAGEHRRKSIARTVYLPLPGIAQHVCTSVQIVYFGLLNIIYQPQLE